MRTLLQDALLRTGVAVHSYSGRGMMGRKCLAISGSLGDCQSAISQAINEELTTLVQFVRDSVKTSVEDDERILEKQEALGEMITMSSLWSQDNLGHGVVFYWKDVAYDTSEDH